MIPDEINIRFEKVSETRYGENPQQDGAVYESDLNEKNLPITRAKQLNGKKMSFNNWLDADAVLKMLWQFKEPFATAFKHLNPSGASQKDDMLEALKGAWECDPLSAFGGIVGVNRTFTKELAEYLTDGKFLEAVIAPKFEDDALEVLSAKKNLRVLEIDTKMPERPGYDIRQIYGGFLVQEFDYTEIKPEDLIYLEDKGIKRPTDEQIEDALFGWKVNRRTKSNTVLLVKDKTTIGIGAGQQNRVDAAFIACYRANKPYEELKNNKRACGGSNLRDVADYIGLSLEGRTKGSFAVSSAFYPFPDTIEVLHAFGVEGSLSPAGSIRDEASYDALRRNNMSAVHTPYVEKGGYKGGMRAFLH